MAIAVQSDNRIFNVRTLPEPGRALEAGPLASPRPERRTEIRQTATRFAWFGLGRVGYTGSARYGVEQVSPVATAPPNSTAAEAGVSATSTRPLAADPRRTRGGT